MVGECAAYSQRDDITEAPKLQPPQAKRSKNQLKLNSQHSKLLLVGSDSELLIFKKPRDHDENDDFGLNMTESKKTLAFE